MGAYGRRRRGCLHVASFRRQQTVAAVVALYVLRSVELRDIFTLTGRLGYADDRWLAYAKGGWANAKVSASYSPGGHGHRDVLIERQGKWMDGRPGC